MSYALTDAREVGEDANNIGEEVDKLPLPLPQKQQQKKTEFATPPTLPKKNALTFFESQEKRFLRAYFERFPRLQNRVNDIDEILADYHGNANVLFEKLEKEFGEPVVPKNPLIKEQRSNRSIFDKLTDVKQYTGSHVHRFDKKTGERAT